MFSWNIQSYQTLDQTLCFQSTVAERRWSIRNGYLLPSRKAKSCLEYILRSLLCLRETFAAEKTFVFVLCPVTAWMSIEFSLDWCSQPFLVKWLLDGIEEYISHRYLVFQKKINKLID